MRWARVGAALLTALCCCSAGMQRNPNGWKPSQPSRCDADLGNGIGDLVVGALAIAGGVALSRSDGGCEDCDSRAASEALSGLVVAFGAIWAFGGVIGLASASSCRDDQDARRKWKLANGIDDTPEQRRRAPKRRVSAQCQEVIDAYLGETRPEKKALLERDMPEQCKKELVTSSEQR